MLVRPTVQLTTAVATVGLSLSAMTQPLPEVPAGMFQQEVSEELVKLVRRELPEASAVNAEFLNPIYDPILSVTENAQITLTFLDEGAGYRNSLGYFTYSPGAFDGLTYSDVDLDGYYGVSFNELTTAVPGVGGGLLFPNSSRLGSGGQLVAGDSILLGDGEVFNPGTEVGFFLIQNAWRGNGEVKSYTENGGNALTFYSVDMLNPENRPENDINTSSADAHSRHVAMLFNGEDQDGVIMGFEDLKRTGWNYNPDRSPSDNDFNDAVFRVTSNPIEAIASSNIPTAVAVLPESPDNLFQVQVCENSRNAIQDYLPERTNVNAEFLNPEYDPNLIISEATQVAVTFNDEGASFQNSLGYFTYQEDTFAELTHGMINTDATQGVSLRELSQVDGVDVGMVFAKASALGKGGPLEHGDTALLGDGLEFEAGTRVGFFLVQDGWDVDHVKGFGGDTQDPLVLYSLDMLNPENDLDGDLLTDSLEHSTRHVAMLFANESRESIVMGIEDLHRLDPGLNTLGYASDEDFNDHIFCVWAIQSQALSQSNIFVNPTSIPEPGSLTALLLTGLVLRRRRRH